MNYDNPFELLSKFSHDISNYSFAISGCSQLLVSDMPELSNNKYFIQLNQAQNALDDYIAHVAQYRHSFEFELKPINPVSVIEACSNASSNQGKAIQTETDLVIPHILGNTAQLQIAVNALITNALEASDNTSPVAIRLTANETSVILQVINSGDKPSDDVLNHATDLFFTTKADHYGLGLSIANNVVKAHNGKLSISADATETCVSIEIPAI